MSTSLSSFSRESLTDVLRVLKDYKNTLRQVGKRAQITDRQHPIDLIPRVEYAPGLEKELIDKALPKALEKYFPEYQWKESLILESNPKLVAGIRIRYGDDLVDLSFQKFTHLFHH